MTEKEPTIEELLSFFNGLISGCLANKNLKDESYCDSPCREYIQAIRRRIERKVSREWVEKWAKNFPYMKGKDIKIDVLENLIAMLKELGYEVEE